MSDVDPSCRLSGVFVKDEKTGRIKMKKLVESFCLMRHSTYW